MVSPDIEIVKMRLDSHFITSGDSFRQVVYLRNITIHEFPVLLDWAVHESGGHLQQIVAFGRYSSTSHTSRPVQKFLVDTIPPLCKVGDPIGVTFLKRPAEGTLPGRFIRRTPTPTSPTARCGLSHGRARRDRGVLRRAGRLLRPVAGTTGPGAARGHLGRPPPAARSARRSRQAPCLRRAVPDLPRKGQRPGAPPGPASRFRHVLSGRNRALRPPSCPRRAAP